MRGLRKPTAAALALLLIIALLCGCSAKRERLFEREGYYLNTYISLKIWSDKDGEELLDGAFALCSHYDELFDMYSEDGALARINAADGEPCKADDDTLALLRLGEYYATLSQGRFDLTCGRVTELWSWDEAEPTVPEPSALAEALKTVGWGSVSIEGSMVTLPKGTKLDAGGLAKGYIADRMAEYLTENGVDKAIIDLGGNIVVLGDKGGEGYRVGIQSPFEPSGYAGVLRVKACSVVTAGSYQRCFLLDDIEYHHILDLSTGMPAKTGLAAVTVIAPSSADADALATIAFLLGAEEGMKLLESIEGVSAVFIEENGNLLLTEGAQAMYEAY